VRASLETIVPAGTVPFGKTVAPVVGACRTKSDAGFWLRKRYALKFFPETETLFENGPRETLIQTFQVWRI